MLRSDFPRSSSGEERGLGREEFGLVEVELRELRC